MCFLKEKMLLNKLLLVFLMFIATADTASKLDYYNLRKYLLYNVGYDKTIRPVDFDNSSLFVYMKFLPLSLVKVDAKDQALELNCKINLQWMDQVLSWWPGDYGSIDSLLFQQQEIWLPDITVANSVVQQDSQLGYEQLPVRVWYNGLINWQPTLITRTSCDIDVTYYPFDTQLCFVEFQTALSLSDEVDINIDTKSALDFQHYTVDGNWDLVDSYGENLKHKNNMSTIRYSLVLRRRTMFYIVNIIFPVLFISLVAAVVFALPPDEGEKMGTGITVLLAYAVYLTIISDHLPSTSIQISILAVYLTMLLGVTAISIFITVFVLRTYHRPVDQPVTEFSKKVVHALRFLNCIIRPWEILENKSQSLLSINLKKSQSLEAVSMKSAQNNSDNMDSMDKDEVTGEFPVVVSTYSGKDKVENLQQAQNKLYQDTILDDPITREEVTDVRENTSDNSGEITWREVATQVDWFLFNLFSGIVLLATVLCFLSLIIGSSVNEPFINRPDK